MQEDKALTDDSSEHENADQIADDCK